MKVYLVGGAVRDALLQVPITERDWVVVGETPHSMRAAGFQQVGKDFPVFLHPETKEEYALARKERKIAQGYHGFAFDIAADVTLEEDLLRRDLTINAMAQDSAGKIIDPYGGADDIKQKKLRHVSPAFAEDPVRILRIARFAARFPEFEVAAETQHILACMVDNGEVQALVVERVWKEFMRAMTEVAPWRFIEVLDACGALAIIFPILHTCKTEIIAHLPALTASISDGAERVMVLFSMLSDVTGVQQMCQYYRAPKAMVDMLILLVTFKNFHNEYTPRTLLDFFYRLDAFRRPQRFTQWLKLQGMHKNFSTLQRETLCLLLQEILSISVPADLLQKDSGKAIGVYIEQQRLYRIAARLAQLE